MEEILTIAADAVSNLCEAATILVIVVGAVETLIRGIMNAGRLRVPHVKKQLWVGFAGWILLSLEFALAADIVSTAIAPTWDDIGRLAAIAAIRTLLNLFLERDLKEVRTAGEAAEA